MIKYLSGLIDAYLTISFDKNGYYLLIIKIDGTFLEKNLKLWAECPLILVQKFFPFDFTCKSTINFEA